MDYCKLCWNKISEKNYQERKKEPFRYDIKIGQRFGKLEIVEFYDLIKCEKSKKMSRIYVLCRCDCDKETIVKAKELRNGIKKDCGTYKCKTGRERFISPSQVKELPSKQETKYIGFVYLINCIGFPYYKIGHTKRRTPNKRLEEMQTNMPFELGFVYLAKIKNVFWVEKKLHKEYEHYRKRGEWFQLTEKQVSDIKNYLRNEGKAEVPPKIVKKTISFPSVDKLELSPKEELFCSFYALLDSPTFNKKGKSAIAAGYTGAGAGNAATALIRKEKIQNKISEINIENAKKIQKFAIYEDVKQL